MKPKESRLGAARLTGRNWPRAGLDQGAGYKRPIDFAPKAEGRLPAVRKLPKAGISSWRDALVTAGLVRSMLGMSPDAWERARLAMGEAGATVAVAAILERAGESDRPAATCGL